MSEGSTVIHARGIIANHPRASAQAAARSHLRIIKDAQ
jgi:hypothetical protein